MLLLGEDGVVGLEVVLLEQVLSVGGLDVEEGVTHADEDRRHGEEKVKSKETGGEGWRGSWLIRAEKESDER